MAEDEREPLTADERRALAEQLQKQNAYYQQVRCDFCGAPPGSACVKQGAYLGYITHYTRKQARNRLARNVDVPGSVQR